MNSKEFQRFIRECSCNTCRALIQLKDEARADLRFSPTRAGRLCEMAVVAAAGADGLHENAVVQARRKYANEHRIDLGPEGMGRNSNEPTHIHQAVENSNHNPNARYRVNLGTAHASYDGERYFIRWGNDIVHKSEQYNALIEGSKGFVSLEEEQESFEEEIKRSRWDSEEVRRKRLRNALAKPEVFIATTTVFKRNPDVVAEVLARADDKCENPKCDKPIPFLRTTDQSTYLEVHHKTPLAQGGDDTVENAIALCPNCHREAHFGGLTFK